MERDFSVSFNSGVSRVSFNAPILLVRKRQGHPVCKKPAVFIPQTFSCGYPAMTFSNVDT